MDDYHDLRSWDSYMSRATRARLNGNHEITKQALEQARSSALSLSDPVPYLQITDNKFATDFLKEDPRKAAKLFRATIDSLEKNNSASSQQMIAQFQLVYARNRLAFIKVDQGHKNAAHKLFEQSLVASNAITNIKAQRDDVLPFRVEEFLALVGLLESMESKKNGIRALFQRACELEDSYIFDKTYEQRFQKCAQALREIDYREDDQTPVTLPFELPAQSAQIEGNIDLVRAYIVQTLSSRFRTRHDDANLVVTGIRLAAILEKLDRLPEARNILIRVARQTNGESLATTNVWRDLIRSLDGLQQTPASIIVLTNLVNQPHRKEKVDPFLQADMLFELGRRELAAGDRQSALAHLTESHKLFEQKCYKLGALSISSSSRKMKAVEAVLARAQSRY